MKEISIEAEQVKRSTISDLRLAARNEGIFGDINEENQILFPVLEKKYQYSVEDKNIIILLPSTASKETLLEIK
ncbi:hypothetical protein H6768_06280 [Candidatus Peribacteria bacterium]|nr:hypothetical protein [Candidatus Peribacteria bacterium]